MSQVGFWVRDPPPSSHMGSVTLISMTVLLSPMNAAQRGGGRIICMPFATLLLRKKKKLAKSEKCVKLTC